jgi:hypothetical protein
VNQLPIGKHTNISLLIADMDKRRAARGRENCPRLLASAQRVVECGAGGELNAGSRGLRCVSRGQLRALSSECRKSGVNILTARSANFNKQLSLIIILLMRCNALLALLAGSHRRAHHHLQVNKQTIYTCKRDETLTRFTNCVPLGRQATS